MARRDVSMTEEEVRAFIQTGRKLQVATNGPWGFPHLTTLWFVVLDDQIAFRSFTKSQRIVNLRRDSRLTVLVEDGDTYGTLRGVMIQGHAHLVEDRDVVLRLYGMIAARHQGPEASDPATLEALFGRFADKNTAVLVEPERVVSWDHTKL